MNINNQTEYKKPLGSRLFILITVCMIVVAMAVPAFAAEVYYPPYPDGWPSFIYPYEPSEYVYFFGRNSYTVGSGQFNDVPVVYYASSDVVVNYVPVMDGFRPVSGVVHGYWYNGSEWVALNDVGPQGSFIFHPFVSASVDIYDLDGNLYWSVPLPPDLGQEVTGVLPTVLGWIQQTLNALFVEGGALQGLLLLVAVPVAITLLFLGARFIRNVIWGA